MKNIPNIKLTIDEYMRITEEQGFSKGGEGVICTTDNPNTLYKFFKNSENEFLIDMPENKVKKIARLYQLNLNFFSLMHKKKLTISRKITYKESSINCFS